MMNDDSIVNLDTTVIEYISNNSARMPDDIRASYKAFLQSCEESGSVQQIDPLTAQEEASIDGTSLVSSLSGMISVIPQTKTVKQRLKQYNFSKDHAIFTEAEFQKNTKRKIQKCGTFSFVRPSA